MADNAVDNPECGSLQSLSNECFSLHRFSSQVRPLPSSRTLNIVVVSVLFSNFHTFTHCCFSFIGAMGLYMYMFGYVKQFNLHRFSKLRTLFSIIEIVLASILRCQDHQHDHNVCDVWHVKMSKITIVLVLRNNITYHMNVYIFDSI